MALRPEELETKTFETARRGFNQTQVRSYLYSIAHALRTEQSSGATSTDYAAHEATLEIIASARQTAESIRAEAYRQADDIRRAAHQELAEASEVAALALAATEASLAADRSQTSDNRIDRTADDVAQPGGETTAKAQRLLELRAETERLHVEATNALEAATLERHKAEAIRADSHEEIQRLRLQIETLRASAEQQIRTVAPGAMLTLGSAMPAPDTEPEAPSGENITVVEGGVSDENPLANAVKSAVGNAVESGI